jgi:hypothetical protein
VGGGGGRLPAARVLTHGSLTPGSSLYKARFWKKKKNIHHVNISYIFPLGDRQQHGCTAVFATMKLKHMPDENNKFSKEGCQQLVFK